MIPNLEVLGSLVKDLFNSLNQMFYLALPVAILFSVVVSYLKSGDVDYVDILKRSFVAALLLASFPEISNLILDLCDGLALKIDNMSGLETFMRMAEEKSKSYAGAKNVLILKFDDLFMAVLSFLSFIVLYFARFVTVALYYYYWVLLSICSPLMILCYVFPRTAGITTNLYRGLIEVGLWKVLWAIQSAMLAAISFGNIYKTDGSYITLIVLNFVIAIAMLFTPYIVKSLIGAGVESTAQTIGVSAVAAMAALPMRAVKVQNITRGFLSDTKSYASHKMQSMQRKINRP